MFYLIIPLVFSQANFAPSKCECCLCLECNLCHLAIWQKEMVDFSKKNTRKLVDL